MVRDVSGRSRTGKFSLDPPQDGFAVANMTKELRRSCSTLLRQAPTVATDVPLRTPKAFASRQAAATKRGRPECVAINE